MNLIFLNFPFQLHQMIPLVHMNIFSLGENDDKLNSSSTSTQSYEVLLYTSLLLLLWIVLRLTASCLTSVWKYVIEKTTNEIKVDPFVQNVKYAVSYWSDRGGRPYQEDRYSFLRHNDKAEKSNIKGDISMYGIFDGHGGFKAAEFCKEKLLSRISSQINSVDISTIKNSIANSFIA